VETNIHRIVSIDSVIKIESDVLTTNKVKVTDQVFMGLEVEARRKTSRSFRFVGDGVLRIIPTRTLKIFPDVLNESTDGQRFVIRFLRVTHNRLTLDHANRISLVISVLIPVRLCLKPSG